MTELPKLKAIPANPRKPCAGCYFEHADECIGKCEPMQRADQLDVIWVEDEK